MFVRGSYDTNPTVPFQRLGNIELALATPRYQRLPNVTITCLYGESDYDCGISTWARAEGRNEQAVLTGTLPVPWVSQGDRCDCGVE